MTLLRLITGGALLAVAVPAIAAAQTKYLYAPLVLQLPAGTRPLAMGNVGIASRDDDAIFYNPAQLVIARGMSASAERYSAAASGGTLSAVTRLGSGGIGIGMRTVSYQTSLAGFPVTRASMLNDGSGPGTSLEATVGVAQVFKGLRIGVAAKYVEDNAQLVRVSRGAFDLGLSKDVFKFYTVGLSVQNMGKAFAVSCVVAAACPTPPGNPNGGSGAQSTRVYLPLRTTLGGAMSHQLGEFDFVGTAAVSLLMDDFVSPAGGAELGYSWLDGYNIAIRAGARRTLPGERPFTAGAAFSVDRVSIDYALETLSGSRIGHRIGLRVR